MSDCLIDALSADNAENLKDLLRKFPNVGAKLYGTLNDNLLMMAVLMRSMRKGSRRLCLLRKPAMMLA